MFAEKTDRQLWIVVCGVQLDAKSVFDALVESGALPPRVKLHCLLFPDDTLGDTRVSEESRFLKELPVYKLSDGAGSARYFDRFGKQYGLLQSDAAGRPRTMDLYSSESPRRIYARVYFGDDAAERRIVYFDQQGTINYETILSSRGTPFISSTVNPDGWRKDVVVFNLETDSGEEELRGLGNWYQARAQLLESFLLTKAANGAVVFSDEPTTVPLLTNGARNALFSGIAVMHSNHFDGDGQGVAGRTKLRGWAQHYRKKGNLQRLVCVTAAQLNDVRELYPEWNESNSIAISHGIEAPEALERSGYSKRLLVLSRLDRDKPVSPIIEGFAKACKSEEGLSLDVVGDGPQRGQLEELSTSLGVAPLVHFHGWDSDTARWYSGADCLLTNPTYESFGLTILEAFAQGCPVISSRAFYGPRELIEHGVNGLFADRTPDGFCERILDIYKDSTFYEKLSANAFSTAGRYSNEKYEREWLGLLGDS
ncbi:MAG: glycosyltransferase [Corynebacterium sp.]|nr:glycosyltransferase [Corynebacterium sp.]